MKITNQKIRLISYMAMLMGMFTIANAQGINFFHGTFAEAKAKAGEENKLLFVDAYASWCGPCKWMAANTFTDEKVGTYFNENFICVKMNVRYRTLPLKDAL